MRKPCEFYVRVKYSMNGAEPAEAWCKTHQMPPSADGLCAVGRVDKAVEDGLAEIAETLQAIAAALKGVA